MKISEETVQEQSELLHFITKYAVDRALGKMFGPDEVLSNAIFKDILDKMFEQVQAYLRDLNVIVHESRRMRRNKLRNISAQQTPTNKQSLQYNQEGQQTKQISNTPEVSPKLSPSSSPAPLHSVNIPAITSPPLSIASYSVHNIDSDGMSPPLSPRVSPGVTPMSIYMRDGSVQRLRLDDSDDEDEDKEKEKEKEKEKDDSKDKGDDKDMDKQQNKDKDKDKDDKQDKRKEEKNKIDIQNNSKDKVKTIEKKEEELIVKTEKENVQSLTNTQEQFQNPQQSSNVEQVKKINPSSISNTKTDENAPLKGTTNTAYNVTKQSQPQNQPQIKTPTQTNQNAQNVKVNDQYITTEQLLQQQVQKQQQIKPKAQLLSSQPKSVTSGQKSSQSNPKTASKPKSNLTVQVSAQQRQSKLDEYKAFIQNTQQPTQQILPIAQLPPLVLPSQQFQSRGFLNQQLSPRGLPIQQFPLKNSNIESKSLQQIGAPLLIQQLNIPSAISPASHLFPQVQAALNPFLHNASQNQLFSFTQRQSLKRNQTQQQQLANRLRGLPTFLSKTVPTEQLFKRSAVQKAAAQKIKDDNFGKKLIVTEHDLAV
ncbi:MAG: hypothetical protein EZS28_031637 [Streblomastix strix]|uniref:Uncharacterized protein n=1 Tax=Streblomastix strix TaxID=222440 RepID=A0A5J4UR22_9EUKA|nr:MAG: hypothetical protein EZS28_031637 [Streblomastix strix]